MISDLSVFQDDRPQKHVHHLLGEDPPQRLRWCIAASLVPSYWSWRDDCSLHTAQRDECVSNIECQGCPRFLDFIVRNLTVWQSRIRIYQVQQTKGIACELDMVEWSVVSTIWFWKQGAEDCVNYKIVLYPVLCRLKNNMYSMHQASVHMGQPRTQVDRWKERVLNPTRQSHWTTTTDPWSLPLAAVVITNHDYYYRII